MPEQKARPRRRRRVGLRSKGVEGKGVSLHAWPRVKRFRGAAAEWHDIDKKASASSRSSSCVGPICLPAANFPDANHLCIRRRSCHASDADDEDPARFGQKTIRRVTDNVRKPIARSTYFSHSVSRIAATAWCKCLLIQDSRHALLQRYREKWHIMPID